MIRTVDLFLREARAALTPPLIAYFALACAVSWALWLPIIASKQGWWMEGDITDSWHYAGAAGPLVAATIVSFATAGWAGLRALLGQYSPSRVRPRWLAFAILSPTLLFFAAVLVSRPFEESWPSLGDLGRTGDLPDVGFVAMFVIQTVAFGIGEETGWRGFALPRLQERLTAFRATMVLAAFWAFWHVPSFLENDSYQHMNAFMSVGWLIGLFAAAIFLTWLYNSSGSLLVLVLWHGLFNTFVASDAGAGEIAFLMTFVIIFFAVSLTRNPETQDLGLSRRETGKTLLSS